jgi:hypothetical protein
MEKNVGGYDRIARAVVGPVLVVVGLAALGGFLTLAAGLTGTVVAAVLVLVGLVLSVTAVTRKCPLNRALGLNTYRGGRTGERTDAADRPGGRAG